MTESQAAAIWPVMKAFSEGKQVQARYPGTTQWESPTNPTFSELHEWRIKPELFEGKFIVYPDGHAYSTEHASFVGTDGRIVTLREVEEKP